MYIEYRGTKINLGKFVEFTKSKYELHGVSVYCVTGYTKFGQTRGEAQDICFDTVEERDEFWNKIK